MSELRSYVKGLTNAQLIRFWNQCWDRMTRYDGYQPYGHDWPTMRVSRPGWHLVLSTINSEGLSRQRERTNND